MQNSKKIIQRDSSIGASLQNIGQTESTRFLYSGKSICLLLHPLLVGVLLCCMLVPSFRINNEHLLISFFIQSYRNQIYKFISELKEKALERKSRYSDFDIDELVHYVVSNSCEPLMNLAFKKFQDALAVYSEKGMWNPSSIASLVKSVINFILKNASYVNNEHTLNWDTFFNKCSAVDALRNVVPIKNAVAAAVREASLWLINEVPQLIYDYHVINNNGYVGKGILSADLEAAVGEPLLTVEQTIDIKLRLYSDKREHSATHTGTSLVKRNSDILEAFYGGRAKIVKGLLSMGCRVYNLATSSDGFHSSCEDLENYQNIEDFVGFISINNYSVGQLLEYAITGSFIYFGICTPEANYQSIVHKIITQGFSLDDNVLEIVFSMIHDEVQKKDLRNKQTSSTNADAYQTGFYRGRPWNSNAAVAEFIQLSNSRINKKLGEFNDNNNSIGHIFKVTNL